MNPMVKWIGGASLFAIAGFAGVGMFADANLHPSNAKSLQTPAVKQVASPEAGSHTLFVKTELVETKTPSNHASGAARAADTPIPGAVSVPAPSSPPVTSASRSSSPTTITLSPAAAKAASKPGLSRAVVPAQRSVAARKAAITKVADERFVVKRVLPIEGPIKYGDWFWDDEGVPAGPLVMTVDLDARVISVFRGGYEIGAAAVLLGTQKHPTPIGTFPILTKERHNVSEKYDNAPMPWTLRLTWDGIAIHGGGEVENGYASHGCIGAPDGFAAKLFDVARKGDKVIITRGKSLGLGQKIL